MGTRSDVSGGNFFVRANRRTESLMLRWRALIKGNTNQIPLNDAIARCRKDGLTVSLLPVADFPSGSEAEKYPNAYVYHANWRRFFKPKIKFFRALGIWKPEVLYPFNYWDQFVLENSTRYKNKMMLSR